MQVCTPLERARPALAIEADGRSRAGPAVTYFRWMVPANFEEGPANFFNQMPADQRERLQEQDVLERACVRGFLARGVGAPFLEEIVMLSARTLDALELFIGEKPYLMGRVALRLLTPFVFATLAAAMTPFFDTPDTQRERSGGRRLVAYVTLDDGSLLSGV